MTSKIACKECVKIAQKFPDSSCSRCYNELRAKGICVVCKTAKSVPEHTKCVLCHKASMTRFMSHGLCLKCKMPREDPMFPHCKKCHTQESDALLAQGKCVGCRQIRENMNFPFCKVCFAKRAKPVGATPAKVCTTPMQRTVSVAEIPTYHLSEFPVIAHSKVVVPKTTVSYSDVASGQKPAPKPVVIVAPIPVAVPAPVMVEQILDGEVVHVEQSPKSSVWDELISDVSEIGHWGDEADSL